VKVAQVTTSIAEASFRVTPHLYQEINRRTEKGETQKKAWKPKKKSPFSFLLFISMHDRSVGVNVVQMNSSTQ
jgi:hypothetical protein